MGMNQNDGNFWLQMKNFQSQGGFQLPLLGKGKKYWVDGVNGNDANDGLTPATAKKAIDGTRGAYGLMVAGNNDVLVVIGNGSGVLRLDTAFAWSKAATHLYGLCNPGVSGQTCRIANSLATTAFANFFTISGAGCVFQNIEWFHSFTTDGNNQIAVTITGASCAFKNCQFSGISKGSDAGGRCVLLGANHNYFEDCTFGNEGIGSRSAANATLEFTGAAAVKGAVFNRCNFQSVGTNAGVLHVKALANGIGGTIIFRDCVFQNTGTAFTSYSSINATQVGWIIHLGSLLLNTGTYGDTTFTRVPGFTSATNFQLSVPPAA